MESDSAVGTSDDYRFAGEVWDVGCAPIYVSCLGCHGVVFIVHRFSGARRVEFLTGFSLSLLDDTFVNLTWLNGVTYESDVSTAVVYSFESKCLDFCT